MKKLLFIALVSTLALYSCSKSNDLSTTSYTKEVSVAEVPVAITDYVYENYPDASISTVYQYFNCDTTYSVTLNSWEMIMFGQGNAPFQYRYMAFADDSTGFGCPGGGNEHQGGHHGGGMGEGHHNGHHYGGPGHMDNGIPLEELPTAITDFIATSYVDYTAHRAWTDTLCAYGNVINVMIVNADTTDHMKLVFDDAANFIASAVRIESLTLPTSVTDVLANDFADYTYRDMSEQFTTLTGAEQYRVFLHGADHVRLEVMFEADGTVICQQ